MNKNRFRRVFSKRLGMLVAVAENVTSQGKQAGESSGVSVSGRELGVVSTMSAMALALVAFHPSVSRAQSLPTNGQVMAGQASISLTNPGTMTINQGTQRIAANTKRRAVNCCNCSTRSINITAS